MSPLVMHPIWDAVSWYLRFVSSDPGHHRHDTLRPPCVMNAPIYCLFDLLSSNHMAFAMVVRNLVDGEWLIHRIQ